MNLAEFSERYLGQWKGTKELYFAGPPEPDNVSDSEVVVSPVAKGKFLSFAYTWDLKGESHEGILLVGNGNEAGIATAAWVDSFHMSGKIMNCEGVVDNLGNVNLLGAYEAPPGPDWRWRIELMCTSDELQITMNNISPEGEEVLAVRATYLCPEGEQI